VGYHLFERWNTWIEVNPETASELGISDGDWVWVESPKAKIKAKVRLYQGTMPDVVNIPFGLGHNSNGRWAKHIGSNPYQLISDDIDPLTDYPLSYTTMVRIYKT
jgi:molybdopterin-containing oxidoreductase family iron-sulfur binding subunit